MPRDVHAEPLLATTRIQGDILPGLLKKDELLLFFTIDSPVDFVAFLKGLPLTSMQTVLDRATRSRPAAVAASPRSSRPPG